MKNMYDALGFEKAKTTTRKAQTSTIEGKIKTRINEVIHETLTTEFPQYFHNLDSTTIMKQDKEGQLLDMAEDSGYRLLIPVNDKVILKNGSNKEVLGNAVRVSDPQIYLKGIKNWVCEYIRLGGKTHTWDEKTSKFVESSTK